VREQVWSLYREVIARLSPVPTLVEWDNEVPLWPVLRDEARRAEAAMAQGREWAATSEPRHAV